MARGRCSLQVEWVLEESCSCPRAPESLDGNAMHVGIPQCTALPWVISVAMMLVIPGRGAYRMSLGNFDHVRLQEEKPRSWVPYIRPVHTVMQCNVDCSHMFCCLQCIWVFDGWYWQLSCSRENQGRCKTGMERSLFGADLSTVSSCDPCLMHNVLHIITVYSLMITWHLGSWVAKMVMPKKQVLPACLLLCEMPACVPGAVLMLHYGHVLCCLVVYAGYLSSEEVDHRLRHLEEGVDLALQRAKIWAKYAKEITTYVEKRSSMGAWSLLDNLSPRPENGILCDKQETWERIPFFIIEKVTFCSQRGRIQSACFSLVYRPSNATATAIPTSKKNKATNQTKSNNSNKIVDTVAVSLMEWDSYSTLCSSIWVPFHCIYIYKCPLKVSCLVLQPCIVLVLVMPSSGLMLLVSDGLGSKIILLKK